MQFPQEMIDELKRDYLLDHDVLLSDEAANRHLLAYAYLGSIIFNLLSDKPEPVLDEDSINKVATFRRTGRMAISGGYGGPESPSGTATGRCNPT